MECNEDTHLELVVSLDMFEIKIDFTGSSAWINAKRTALGIGQNGGVFQPHGKKMEGNFYPLHRINVVTIREASEE